MKYWKMKLTCQSPVHIGSGDSYKKNQYLYEDNGRKAKIYFLNESKWAVFLDRGKLTNHLVDEINRDPTYFSLYDFLSCHYPKKINQVIQTLAKSGVLSNPETADVPYSKNKLKIKKRFE